MKRGDGDPAGRALCWEVALTGPAGSSVRLLLADRFLWRQARSGGDGEGGLRPVWTVEDCGSAVAAAVRAEEVTRVLESEHGGMLAAGPWEVLLYDREVVAMGSGRAIPPSLRSRVYTRLLRGSR